MISNGITGTVACNGTYNGENFDKISVSKGAASSSTSSGKALVSIITPVYPNNTWVYTYKTWTATTTTQTFTLILGSTSITRTVTTITSTSGATSQGASSGYPAGFIVQPTNSTSSGNSLGASLSVSFNASAWKMLFRNIPVGENNSYPTGTVYCVDGYLKIKT